MTTAPLFGTDGMRGPLDSPLLAPENICQFGRVLGSLIKKGASPASVTIGRDTRASGLYLESALVAGLTSMGVDCLLVGVLPSSAIAHATKLFQSAFGIVISASHNPASDNGIKLFGPTGFKIEEATEKLMEEEYARYSLQRAKLVHRPGHIFHKESAEQDYLDLMSSAINPTISLKNKRIVIDCAHGAASNIAPQLFGLLDCDIKIIGASPDGQNINAGFGSEYPAQLKNEVIQYKADLGIAFDGDADRVIFIDEKGNTIDGDALLAIFALHFKQSGLLHKNTLVSTVMSSVALDQALNPHGINVERTPVGDKYVTRHLVNSGFSFGGENSGHLILLPETSTGDGIFFALQFLNILGSSDLLASQLGSFYEPTPKILKNIPVAKKIPLNDMPNTANAMKQANLSLKNMGRVMLRYSGTENKLRILVEAPSQLECQQIADEIEQEFKRELLGKAVEISPSTACRN